MLGIDYAAGWALRKRRLQVKRVRKAERRRGKLKWWRKAGSRATRIAKAGVLPELAFGAEVIGMPPPALRDARRIHAATTSVRCAGASTTAKLAVGSDDDQGHDPGILLHNPPFQLILQQLWDKPQARADIFRAWYQARDDASMYDQHKIWQNIHGPVGAAMAHLRRIGVTWPKAFVINVPNQDVAILQTPPQSRSWRFCKCTQDGIMIMRCCDALPR